MNRYSHKQDSSRKSGGQKQTASVSLGTDRHSGIIWASIVQVAVVNVYRKQIYEQFIY